MSQRQLAMAVAVEATQMMALHSLADDRCYQPRGMFCHVYFNITPVKTLLAAY